MHIFAYFFGGCSYFAYYFAYIVFRAYEKGECSYERGGFILFCIWKIIITYFTYQCIFYISCIFCIYSILCIFSIYSIFYILFGFSNLNSDVKPGYKISDDEDQNITPSQPQYHKPDSPHHPADYPAHLMAPPPPSPPTFNFHSFMHRSGVKINFLVLSYTGI